MKQSPLRDFIVGLFVLAGIAAIGYLSIHVGGFTWRRTGGLTVSAEFDQTGGLTERAPVLISGVRVGEVTRISLGENYRAVVEMRLDTSLELSSDTTASIITSGILGDRCVELQPGAEDDLLGPGGRITFTESAIILERLIGQFIYGMTKTAPPAPGAPGNAPLTPE